MLPSGPSVVRPRMSPLSRRSGKKELVARLRAGVGAAPAVWDAKSEGLLGEEEGPAPPLPPVLSVSSRWFERAVWYSSRMSMQILRVMLVTTSSAGRPCQFRAEMGERKEAQTFGTRFLQEPAYFLEVVYELLEGRELGPCNDIPQQADDFERDFARTDQLPALQGSAGRAWRAKAEADRCC